MNVRADKLRHMDSFLWDGRWHQVVGLPIVHGPNEVILLTKNRMKLTVKRDRVFSVREAKTNA